MQIRKAERKQAKIKMALQGPSGSGKTMSALKIAYGLIEDWNKIAVIDTENGSSNLYAHMGSFQVLPLNPPYSPERYIEAIETCTMAGMKVTIIDSVSHEWDGSGGILDIHGSMAGNSFTNWSKVTPRHNSFVNAILLCPCHVICTIRTKTEYALQEKNGKFVPEKMGLKGIQRDGIDYEFTIVLDLDIKHYATCSKNRTNLFSDKTWEIPDKETGKMIREWCDQGSTITDLQEAERRISESKSIKELMNTYNLFPELRNELIGQFKQRKAELQSQQTHYSTSKLQENGSDDD